MTVFSGKKCDFGKDRSVSLTVGDGAEINGERVFYILAKRKTNDGEDVTQEAFFLEDTLKHIIRLYFSEFAGNNGQFKEPV